MLQTVRKYTQGWVATVMGLILSFAFILWGIENYLSGNAKKHPAAKVNGKTITTAEVDADFQKMLMRIKDQVGSSFNLPPTMMRQLKLQALNNLIMQSVLTQAATNAGFNVTTQETAAMIRQMPAFQNAGRFSKERFEQIIHKMGYSQQDFVTDVSQTLLLNQVASGVIGSNFVLPGESNQAIALMEQKRDIDYVIISSDAFKKNVKFSPEEITAIYQYNKEQFKTPPRVQIEYIQLSADDLKKNISVSEQEVKNYLNNNSDLDHKTSKAIAKAKESIKQQKAEEAFLVASDKLTDLSYTHPKSLNEAASALGLKIKTSEFFSQEGGVSNITKNPKVINAAFNADLLKDRTNSNLIEVSSGNVIVLKIKDYQPEAIQPIKDVKEKIEQTLVSKEATKKAKQRGESILRQIKNKDDFTKLAASEHLTVTTKHQITRNEKNLNPELVKLAFNLSPTSQTPATGALLSNGDYALLVVRRSTNFPTEKVSKQQQETMKKIYSDTYGKLEYNLYTENQVQNTKVKILLKE